ncbi:unnamed protein product [Lampetra planeri]
MGKSEDREEDEEKTAAQIGDLIHCTNEMNVNIPQLADTLFERTANSSWVVVFKALITTHHLMMYGNESVLQAPLEKVCVISLHSSDLSGQQC